MAKPRKKRSSTLTSPSMQILRDKDSMRAWSRAQKALGRTVGFVPTMGSLHAGHLALVKEAKKRADVVVTSIYVNPTQFGPNEDFTEYPRMLDADAKKLTGVGCHALFAPRDLYARSGPPHETWVDVTDLTQTLCGSARPGHFRGVTTIVTKLFLIVEPDVAIFGDKDYQQRRVIQRMTRDLDIPVEVVGMPIQRDTDGLALSSRNARLLPDDRLMALAIPRAIAWAQDAFAKGERRVKVLKKAVREQIEASGPRVDYIEIVSDATLLPAKGKLTKPAVLAVAAYAGDVRLIDNVELR